MTLKTKKLRIGVVLVALKNLSRQHLENTRGSNAWTWVEMGYCEGLDSSIMVFVGSIIIINGRITACRGNHEHPTIQTLFPNNSAVFQGNKTAIYSDGAVLHSCFEWHEGAPIGSTGQGQSSHLKSIEPLWSILGTRGRNKFLPPTCAKQLEDDEWNKTSRSPCQGELRLCWIQEAVHRSVNKEMCAVSVVCLIFFPYHTVFIYLINMSQIKVNVPEKVKDREKKEIRKTIYAANKVYVSLCIC